MKKVILLLLCLVAPVQATPHFEWGLGLDGNSNGKPTDGVKYLDLSNRIKGKIWDQAYGGGYWFDRSHGVSTKDSAYGYYMLGLAPKYKYFYIEYFVGPSLISTTDDRLSSNFQFTHDVGIGFKDERGVRLGLCYRHFSNAGLMEPNLGRDFLGFQTEFPLKLK